MKERVFKWDGSGVSPSVIFSNETPKDTSVIGEIVKGVLWGEVLDPHGI